MKKLVLWVLAAVLCVGLASAVAAELSFAEMHKGADALPEALYGKTFWFVMDDAETSQIGTADELQALLPKAMRARSLEDADGVLILRQKEVTGGGRAISYKLYGRLLDSDTLYYLYHVRTAASSFLKTPEELTGDELWAHIGPMFEAEPQEETLTWEEMMAIESWEDF